MNTFGQMEFSGRFEAHTHTMANKKPPSVHYMVYRSHRRRSKNRMIVSHNSSDEMKQLSNIC